jgi:hypothetical protein
LPAAVAIPVTVARLDGIFPSAAPCSAISTRRGIIPAGLFSCFFIYQTGDSMSKTVIHVLGDPGTSLLEQYAHILPSRERKLTITLTPEEMASVLFAYDYINFPDELGLNAVMAELKDAIRSGSNTVWP